MKPGEMLLELESMRRAMLVRNKEIIKEDMNVDLVVESDMAIADSLNKVIDEVISIVRKETEGHYV